jgi:hypothetical protein
MDGTRSITKKSGKPGGALTEQRAGQPSSILLTPEQLAKKLSVPPTWVREKTRERARVRDSDPLPVIRLGKYVRFDPVAVDAWLARQST